jgi:probable HAF family extracellular repeat protein
VTAVHYPKAANTWLFDINQLGQWWAASAPGASLVRGFLLVNGAYTTVAFPDAQVTYALAINDNGDVVGSDGSGRVSNGFLWQNGTLTTINHPNSRYKTVLTGSEQRGRYRR